jgi:hypothetical protein
MKTKKTFRINDLLNYVNDQLKRTDQHASDSFKEGMCVLLEHVLNNAKAYEGYNHNYWLQQGYDEWVKAGKPGFPEKNQFIYGPTGQKFNRYYFHSQAVSQEPADRYFYFQELI